MNLLQSGETHNIELAIQLNIGLKLMDWEEVIEIRYKGALAAHVLYRTPRKYLPFYKMNNSLSARLEASLYLFSKKGKQIRESLGSKKSMWYKCFDGIRI